MSHPAAARSTWQSMTAPMPSRPPGGSGLARYSSSNGQSLIVHFKDLPPGEYAAVAFQDVNGNGILDKNFLGIPKEPYGFSNGARGSASGPPGSSSAAAVTHNPDGATRIVLK